MQVVELLFESASPCPQQEEDEEDDAEAEGEPSSVRDFLQGGTEEEAVDESGSEEVCEGEVRQLCGDSKARRRRRRRLTGDGDDNGQVLDLNHRDRECASCAER